MTLRSAAVACVAGPDTAYAEARIISGGARHRACRLRSTSAPRRHDDPRYDGGYLLKETYRSNRATRFDPCRRWWRRPDRVPMGEASWRDCGLARSAATRRQQSHASMAAIMRWCSARMTSSSACARSLAGGVPVVYDSDRQATFEDSLALPAPPRDSRVIRRGVR